MGYSDTNFQIGQMLHKEYEATYAAQAPASQPSSFKWISTLGTMLMASFFITQFIIF